MILTLVTYRLSEPVSSDFVVGIVNARPHLSAEQPGVLLSMYVTSADGYTVGGLHLWQARGQAEAYYDATWRQTARTLLGVEPRIDWSNCPVMVDNVNGEVLQSSVWPPSLAPVGPPVRPSDFLESANPAALADASLWLTHLRCVGRPVTSAEKLDRDLEAAAPMIVAVPGMLRGCLYHTENGAEVGGFALWQDRASAEALLRSDSRSRVAELAGVDPVVSWYRCSVVVDNRNGEILAGAAD